MPDIYTKAARRLIEELERESLAANESTEQFYRGLRDVVTELRDRLNCAADELDDKAVAAEVMRLPR